MVQMVLHAGLLSETQISLSKERILSGDGEMENNLPYKDEVRAYLQKSLDENAEHAENKPFYASEDQVAWIMDYFDRVLKYSNATDKDTYEVAELCLSKWDVSDTSEWQGRIDAIIDRLEKEWRAKQLQNLPQPDACQPSGDGEMENNPPYKDEVRAYLQKSLDENAEHAENKPFYASEDQVAWIMDYFDRVLKYSNATDKDTYEVAELCLSKWDVSDTSEWQGRIDAIIDRLEKEWRAKQLQNLPQPDTYQPSEPDSIKSIREKLETTLWSILPNDGEQIHIRLSDFDDFTEIPSVTLDEVKQMAHLAIQEVTSRKNFSDCNPEWQAICKEMEVLWAEVQQRVVTDFQSFVQPIDGDAIPSASDSEIESIESTENFSVSDQSCSTSTKAKATNSPKKKISKGDQCRKVMGIIIERLKRSKEREDLRSKLQKKPSDRDIEKWAGCDYRTILGTSQKSSHLRSIVNTAFDLVEAYKVDESIELLECMETYMQNNGELTDEGWHVLCKTRKWKMNNVR